MGDADPFESPRLLLAGAARHIDTLKARIEEYRRAPGAIPAPDSRGGNRLYIRPGHPLPADLKQVAFDIVHNLRSALDQAVYASTVALTGGDPSNTKFPFGDSEAEAAADAKRGARGVPERIRLLLLAFRPYPAGNRSLWALNKLRNTKSHRILVPMLAGLRPKGIGESEPGLVSGDPTWDPRTGIFETTFQPANAKRPLSAAAYAISIEVQIGTGAFAGEPAIAVFDTLLGQIERIVSVIEAETDRLRRTAT